MHSIFSLIVEHLEEHYPLSDHQWRFWPGRSQCLHYSQLLTSDSSYLSPVKRFVQFFWITRNHLTVYPHTPLVNKLHSIGLPHKLVEWLTDYLPSRKQKGCGQQCKLTSIFSHVWSPSRLSVRSTTVFHLHQRHHWGNLVTNILPVFLLTFFTIAQSLIRISLKKSNQT